LHCDQEWCSTLVQGWFDPRKAISIIHQMSKSENTGSLEVKQNRAFDKIQHCFIIKCQQGRNRKKLMSRK
jgi:hypothetical protein